MILTAGDFVMEEGPDSDWRLAEKPHIPTYSPTHPFRLL